MFPWIFLLFCIGIALLVAELFLPGFGIFGILGIFSFGVAVILTAVSYGIPYMCMAIAIIIIIAFIAFYFIKKNKIYNKVVLTETLTGKDFDEESIKPLLGKRGVCITPLKPFGKVDFDGEIVEAFSNGGYIPEGKQVEVITVSGKNVIVREIKN